MATMRLACYNLLLRLNTNSHPFVRVCSSVSKPSSEVFKSIDDLPGPQKGLSKIAIGKRLISGGWKFLMLQLKGGSPGKARLEGQLQQVSKYGPIFKADFFGLRRLANVKIANPEDVAKVLRAEGHYPVRPDMAVAQHHRRKRKNPPGLFFANGEDWYTHRRVVSKRMLRPKEVEVYVPLFNEIVADFVQRLRKIRGTEGTVQDEIPNLRQELFKWSFEAVSLVLFDQRFGCLQDEMNAEALDFITAVQNFLDSAPHMEVFPEWVYRAIPVKRYRQFTESYDKMYHYTELFIERKIQELDKDGKLEVKEDEKVDFLRFLLSDKDLTRDDLMASYSDVLFAGVDTTSTAMLWVLYLLGKNPEKQEKLHKEVSSVIEPGEQPTVQTLSKMPYLKAWIKETLRLYPVTYLHRVIEQDLVLSGYQIPAGTQIMVLLYAMTQDASQFEDATVFKPERWLKSREQKMQEGKNAFASLAFGFGRRMCVGRRVAELELHLLLAGLVQNFHVVCASGENVQRSAHALTIIPDRPIRVQLIDRD